MADAGRLALLFPAGASVDEWAAARCDLCFGPVHHAPGPPERWACASPACPRAEGLAILATLGLNFREIIAHLVFEDRWPLLYNHAERDNYWAQHPHADLQRLREMGDAFRRGVAVDPAEFDRIVGVPDAWTRRVTRAAIEAAGFIVLG